MSASEIQYGDVIFVQRTIHKHYGIYSGYNQVIHYVEVDGSADKGELQETSLTRFMDGDTKCYICIYDDDGYEKDIVPARVSGFVVSAARMNTLFPDGMYSRDERDRKCYTPEETVERAREAMKGEIKWRLLVNNCEHFATWCKTGVATSKQTGFLAGLLGYGTKKLPAPDHVIEVNVY